jgi:GNAT superfamily N-acetyltransferase
MPPPLLHAGRVMCLCWELKDLADIYGIHVHPDRHRKGIGKLLMSHAIEWIGTRSHQGATLWTLLYLAETRLCNSSVGWRANGATGTVLPGGYPLQKIGCRWISRQW